MNSTAKQIFSSIVPNPVWKFLRKRRIIYKHTRVAEVCRLLIDEYLLSDFCTNGIPVRALKNLGTTKIIWQYWAQGFDNVPSVVQRCLDSVDRWGDDYVVIRLDDSSIMDYIVLPECINKKRPCMSRAYFSDLLRLCILAVYGGLWLDATVFLSGPIPEYVFEDEFFLYQRDPEEENKSYWENAYAYYFGWGKGFRVNMLSSVFYSSKDAGIVKMLCGLMIYYWYKGNTAIPDYFFLQIMFDVLIHEYFSDKNCKLVSDCIPHLLQQSMNDVAFKLASKEDILALTTVHKLTYK